MTQPEVAAKKLVRPKRKVKNNGDLDVNTVQQKGVQMKKKSSGKIGSGAGSENPDNSLADATAKHGLPQHVTPGQPKVSPRTMDHALEHSLVEAMQDGSGSKVETENLMQERASLQELVKDFVASATIGVRCIYIDLSSGGMANAEYMIDPSLTSLTVSLLNGGSFSSAMTKITEVHLYTEFGLQLPVMQRLPDHDRNRAVLVQVQGPDNDQQWLCILEKSSEAAERFLTCIEILRLYASDMEGKRRTSPPSTPTGQTTPTGQN